MMRKHGRSPSQKTGLFVWSAYGTVGPAVTLRRILEPISHQVIEQLEGNAGESASRCLDPHDEDMVLDPGISRSAWWT